MARGAKTDTAETSSRRDEILAVAAEVIADRGIAGATVRDIGQAAGILSGSLYYHFDSKEQIVLDLLLGDVEAELARQTAVVEAGGSAVDVVAGLIRASVRQTAISPNKSLILRNESRAFRDSEALAPLADLRRQSLDLWMGAVQQGMGDGSLRADIDAEVVVRAMFDAVLGAARWFIGGQEADAESLADDLVALYLGGLAAP